MFKAQKEDMVNDNEQVLENDIKQYDQIYPEQRKTDLMEFIKEDEEAKRKAIRKAQGKYSEHTRPQLQSFVPNTVEDPL